MSDFVEFLHEVFADVGPITTRRMFGAHGIYRHEWAQSALDAAMRSQDAKDRLANKPPWRRN